jgi:hypothetical protein
LHRLAAFITPHGLGHATRAIAVMEALQRRLPALRIDLFTTVDEQIFAQTLRQFTMHRVVTDVGLVQPNALHGDLPATVRALDRLLPFSEELLTSLAGQIAECDAVLCDIAPLGIAAADRAGIPSVLLGNFTWDWIYRPYISQCPALDRHAMQLAEIYRLATLRIVTEPGCESVPGAAVCPPVFRRIRTHRNEIREQLGAGNRKIILISLGGIGFALNPWPELADYPDCLFILAGQEHQRQLTSNCLTLPRHGPWHHPDLIGSADLVLFKSGYSTTAECLQAGTRALCIGRPGFAESDILASFITTRLGGTMLNESEFVSGAWLRQLPELLALPRPRPATENGADTAADLVEALVRDLR